MNEPLPDRLDFQRLADSRIAEAQTLLLAGHGSGAYYLAGLAVECALKACVARLTRAESFPPPRKFADVCYSHDLERLIGAAELTQKKDARAAESQSFRKHWASVAAWSVDSRYNLKVGQVEAESMLAAVCDPSHGVLQWLREHW